MPSQVDPQVAAALAAAEGSAGTPAPAPGDWKALRARAKAGQPHRPVRERDDLHLCRCSDWRHPGRPALVRPAPARSGLCRGLRARRPTVPGSWNRY